jgi:hypothetical protein
MSMTVILEDPEVIAEIEELMVGFRLPADAVVERVILEAGAWMPMETLANSYWQERRTFVSPGDDIPPWHALVTRLPVFAKDWDLRVINHPPKFELTHVSGVQVSLSIYDSVSSPLWANEPGLFLRLAEFRCKPTVTVPTGLSKTSSQRQSLIAEARKIVAEIDPLTIMIGLEKDILLHHIEANRAERLQWGGCLFSDLTGYAIVAACNTAALLTEGISFWSSEMNSL